MESFLLFFDISTGELLVIMVAAFLVFGPRKLPEIARKLGKGLNELRRATEEIKNEIRKETSEIKKDFIPEEKKEKENKTAPGKPENSANDLI
ncbi:MAG: twin-arginine translocase TatA/TatE family subunit [Bacteroidales bacterium]|nr:twin-arginine translocase TatA/TatE family subunit [Bacteroidales bacterium]